METINSQVWYYNIKDEKSELEKTTTDQQLTYDMKIEKEATQRRVTRSLFSDIPRNVAVSKFMVHLIKMDGTRLFTVFDDYLRFAIYQKQIPLSHRSFFETILGEKAQKPHFDIDIDITEQNKNLDFEDIKNVLIDNIIRVFKSFNLELKLNTDLILCTSHRADKRSYHIVINNYSHANNLEAKEFYKLVIKEIPKEYQEYIDHKVYSTLQQFRILGSLKIGKGNIKVFQETWNYRDIKVKYRYPVFVESENHKLILQLNASLVTTTSGCKILPILLPEKAVKKYEDTNWEGITKEEAYNALQLLADMNSVSFRNPSFPFIFDGIQDHYIVLKRRHRSGCRICNRIHEHENPYLLVVGNQKTVYFDCRRSKDNKKLFVGKLYPNREPDYEDKYGTDYTLETLKTLLQDSGYEDVNSYILNVADEIKKEKQEKSVVTKQFVPKVDNFVPSGPIPKTGVTPEIISSRDITYIPSPIPKTQVSMENNASTTNTIINNNPVVINNNPVVTDTTINNNPSVIAASFTPLPIFISSPQLSNPVSDNSFVLFQTETKVNDLLSQKKEEKPIVPTHLEPNYGMDKSVNLLVVNNIDQLINLKNQPKNYIPSPKKSLFRKRTPGIIMLPDDNDNKFDKLKQLDEMNNIPLAKKQVKRKEKSSPEVLTTFYGQLLDKK